MFKELFGRGRAQRNEPPSLFSGLSLFVLDIQGRRANILSFVPTELAFSSTLPPEACMGAVTGEGPITAANFQVNPQFVTYLHQQAAKAFARDDGLQKEARRLGGGNVFVIDPRSSVPNAGVPPEDILGCFSASSGTIVADSYQANPRYEVVSSAGPSCLPASFWNSLIADLRGAGKL